MNFMNAVVNFFKDGGVFLYPLALIFVVGVSIAIERYVYLTRETIRNRSLWDDLVPALSAGNFKQVVGLTQNSKASIATILNYGVARVASARRRDDIEKAMDESLLEVIPRIEKRTHYLSSLANVGLLMSPRVGWRPRRELRPPPAARSRPRLHRTAPNEVKVRAPRPTQSRPLPPRA